MIVPAKDHQKSPQKVAIAPASDSADTATSPDAADSGAPTKPKKPRVPLRTRRLLADEQQMSNYFDSAKLIRARPVVGEPPDTYHVEYTVKGLRRGADGKPRVTANHVVEIQLTLEYPRQPPKCKMLTPVFHPNIEPAMICVGDHWTAGERLVDLVIRIGEMIAYQAYNIKSPLDGEAAMWADMNKARLPVDSRDLRPVDEY